MFSSEKKRKSCFSDFFPLNYRNPSTSQAKLDQHAVHVQPIPEKRVFV